MGLRRLHHLCRCRRAHGRALQGNTAGRVDGMNAVHVERVHARGLEGLLVRVKGVKDAAARVLPDHGCRARSEERARTMSARNTSDEARAYSRVSSGLVARRLFIGLNSSRTLTPGTRFGGTMKNG